MCQYIANISEYLLKNPVQEINFNKFMKLAVKKQVFQEGMIFHTLTSERVKQLLSNPKAKTKI